MFCTMSLAMRDDWERGLRTEADVAAKQRIFPGLLELWQQQTLARDISLTLVLDSPDASTSASADKRRETHLLLSRLGLPRRTLLGKTERPSPPLS